MQKWSGIPGHFGKRQAFRKLVTISIFLQANWGINPNGLIIEYCKLYVHLNKHHGRLYTLQKLKLWYGVCQRYACGQDFDRLPFTKVTDRRSKLPYKMKAFKSFLEGTVQERRVALTVLSIYRLISSKNDVIDYSQIEAPRLLSRDFTNLDVNNDKSYLNRKVSEDPSQINLKLLKSWKHCVNTMFPHSQLSNRKMILQGDELHISNKNGPNGHALGGIGLDWLAVKTEGLVNDIFAVAQLTNNTFLINVITSFYNTDVKIHTGDTSTICSARLSLKQEPGGKNRLFAIGDYFTQSALKSLHKYLFALLRRFPEDGTHSHNYVAQINKEWSDSPVNRIYSIDLTGATNFIDCEVLGEIVTSIAGEEYGKHWVNLMVNRDFRGIEDEPRRYTVGQPMGFYSSWAMLAIWNHLMIRTCRHALGLVPQVDTPQYCIIGDDVSILGDDVAHMYLHLCKLMGVPTSPLKGFSPLTIAKVTNPINCKSTMNSVEIAKRIFVDGLELTPISPVEISGGMGNNYNFPSLLLSMEEKGIYTLENESIIKVLANQCPSNRTSLDVALFPMAPSLNWVVKTKENKVSIAKDKDSFWHGLPYPLISQLFYVYIKQRINRSIHNFEEALLPIVDMSPDTTFICKNFEFSTEAHYLCLQYIAHIANELSKDILSRISLVGEQAPLLDNSLEAQVEKSRDVRRTIGLITAIFDLEGIMINPNSRKYLNKQQQTDRIIAEVVRDVKSILM